MGFPDPDLSPGCFVRKHWTTVLYVQSLMGISCRPEFPFTSSVTSLLILILLRPVLYVLDMWVLAVHTNLSNVPLCNTIGLLGNLDMILLRLSPREMGTELSSSVILLMASILGSASMFPGVPIRVDILLIITRLPIVK